MGTQSTQTLQIEVSPRRRELTAGCLGGGVLDQDDSVGLCGQPVPGVPWCGRRVGTAAPSQGLVGLSKFIISSTEGFFKHWSDII